MKGRNLVFTKPSSKTGAINQAVSCLCSIDNLIEKGKMIMDTIKSSQDKLERLQKHIDELKKTTGLCEENQKAFQARIDYLMQEFQLTQAEILEAKSKILREQISELQKKVTTETGTFNVES